jgi:hypothetical protein
MKAITNRDLHRRRPASGEAVKMTGEILITRDSKSESREKAQEAQKVLWLCAFSAF